MASPFDFKNSANNQVRTNNFDWSHANNLTFQLGAITPVFCSLIPAHGSLSFTPTLGLQFMPMVFPIQTRMKARVSFFKVPLRTLWSDYMDFVGNFREGLVEPYIDFKDHIPSTGSLWDYLGLPTTHAGAYGNYSNNTPTFFTKSIVPSVVAAVKGAIDSSSYGTVSVQSSDVTGYEGTNGIMQEIDKGQVGSGTCTLNFNSAGIQPLDINNYVMLIALDSSGKLQAGDVATASSKTSLTVKFEQSWKIYLVFKSSTTTSSYFNMTWLASSKKYRKNNYGEITCAGVTENDVPQELDAEHNPYYDSSSNYKEKQLKISAYAARAYESCYNAYYRDNRNNPYYVDGEVQYNRYIPTKEGGSDNYNYQLRFANWEKDMFTTCVQSPQQGVAPLVGLTTYSDTETLSDGTSKTVLRTALVDENGDKYGVSFAADSDGLTGVNYTKLSDDQPVQQSRSLIELANSGISINDLRNVNAYQKFLELNMRQGYSYRDIIQGRFQVNVRFDELQMPEFIGGFSEDIQMNSIVQSVQRNDTGNYTDQLGAQAGNAGVRRSGKRISVFCDEESIVIGLAYISPVPVYSQILPKHFLYRGLLDHFQPEFANIGFQPVTYRELCPVQAYSDDKDSMYDTFGYNRPWYEMCMQLDSAHGLFRTSLRNFIMNRTFDVKPQLSESFLLIDPSQINDVFSVTEVTDKIFGQIWFDMTAKLPISRDALPRLD